MGGALLEALVAVVLAATAAAGLASAGAAAGAHVRLARERATALSLASERLETLRAGPRDSDADAVAAGGVTFARRWTATDGRGRADALGVVVAWDTRQVALDGEVWP